MRPNVHPVLCLGIATLLASAAAPAHAAPGDLDSTFGTQGVALSAVGDEGAVAMALQADQKILTATVDDRASDRASLRITRFTSAGIVDSTFGISGTATASVATDTLSVVRAMLRQASDNKIVAGRSLDAFAVTRLTTAGAIDAALIDETASVVETE